ncbi:hypothetical protein ACS0TY_015232 [Phlomoides rotata]
MKETKDGLRTGRFSNSPSADLYPLVLDIDDFKRKKQIPLKGMVGMMLCQMVIY